MNEPIQSQVNWVTKSALADYFGCTPRYINTLMRRGIVPYVKTRGFLRFNLSECDRALQRFRTASYVPLQPRPTEAPDLARDSKALLGDLRAPGASAPNVLPPNIKAHLFRSAAEARRFLDEVEEEPKIATQCCGEGWRDDRALARALIVIVITANGPK
jgi:hypothetical protein